MSKGKDARTERDREGADRSRQSEKQSRDGRSSRSSVRMTPERARAIQAQADRAGRNQGFKSRAMAAAASQDEDPNE